MSTPQSELQKEFELERMILFSDAVFAIAITLLIIEIKFPEVHRGASTEEILLLFKPTIIRFLGFILSFVIIGRMWAQHLKFCKYLKSYNDGLIFRNLVFLFFIVCFPFTVSGLSENIRPSFLLPIYIYITNVAFVSISQYSMCSYVFKTHSNLSVPGFEAEKKFILLQSKLFAFVFMITVITIIILSFIFRNNPIKVGYGLYILPIAMIFLRRRLKKYKPVSE